MSIRDQCQMNDFDKLSTQCEVLLKNAKKIDEIASGFGGTVYRIQIYNKDHALKVIPYTQNININEFDKFKNEVFCGCLCSSMVKDNISENFTIVYWWLLCNRVNDYVYINDPYKPIYYYICMDYINGISLEKHFLNIKNTGSTQYMSYRTFMSHIFQLLYGYLCMINIAQIFHNDIATHNIMISPSDHERTYCMNDVYYLIDKNIEKLQYIDFGLSVDIKSINEEIVSFSNEDQLNNPLVLSLYEKLSNAYSSDLLNLYIIVNSYITYYKIYNIPNKALYDEFINLIQNDISKIYENMPKYFEFMIVDGPSSKNYTLPKLD